MSAAEEQGPRDGPRAGPGGRPRLGWLAALAALLLVAAWARVSDYPTVLGTGDLIPLVDGDSQYHLDRALDALARYPKVRHFDPSMNWPKGAFTPWADGFDLGAASFALLMAGHDPARAPLAVALWPVVLGLFATLATVRLVRVAVPGASWRGAALAAGLLAALLPVGVLHSSFGRVDHHVLEALLVALLATWSLRRIPVHPGAAPPAPLGFEVEGALLAGLGTWSFTGAPIYVALAVPPLALAAFRSGRVAGSGGPGLVAGGALAAALSLPAILDHKLLVSFKFPSLLQPALLVLAGLAIAGCAKAGAHPPGRRRAGALRWGAALLLAVAGCAALAPRALGEVHGAVTGWLLHQDPWISTIREFAPLFGEQVDGSPAWSRLYWSLGFSGFFFPVAMVLAGTVAWRRPRVAWLLWFAGAMALLTLVQVRFDRPAAPLVAAVTALAVAIASRALGRGWRRWPMVAPLLLGALLLADPPSRAALVTSPRLQREPVQEMAVDLRDAPPPPSAPGVLSNWSFGHHLAGQGGVPVAVNGFGSYLDAEAFWRAVDVFRGDAAGLDRYMVEGRFGTLLAGAATIGNEVKGAGESLSFARGVLNREYMTSLALSPLLIAGSAIPGWDVPHLPHLMPQRASHAYVAGLSFVLPFLWRYERVAGATVHGTAPAGARVLAELKFTEHRREHTYKAFTTAGADGRWSLVLPFPTGLLRPAFASAAAWSVAAAGGPPRTFALPEAAVRGGERVEVGRLEGKP